MSNNFDVVIVGNGILEATQLSNHSSSAPLKLTPEVDPYVYRILNDKRFLFDLIDGLGSPLNLLFPQNLKSNLDQFQHAFRKNNVIGRVFFAHKCNQSETITRQLAFE